MPRSPRSPLELLVASVATLVPALTAVTLALGTTAPVESCTVPTRRAVWVCAKHAAANKAPAKTIRTDPTLLLFIETSFADTCACYGILVDFTTAKSTKTREVQQMWKAFRRFRKWKLRREAGGTAPLSRAKSRLAA